MMHGFPDVRTQFVFAPTDFFGVVYDLKPVSREAISSLADVKKIVNLCRETNLKVKIVNSTVYNSKTKVRLAYISKSNRLIDAAIRAEHDGDRLKVGELFGYPECCTKFFIDSLKEKGCKNGKNSLIVNIFEHSKPPYSHLLNTVYNTSGKGDSKLISSEPFFQKLGRMALYYVPHHPCSLNCAQSLAIGKKMRKILRSELPEFLNILDWITTKPLIVWDDNFFCTFEGIKNNQKLFYERIFPELSFIDEHTANIFKKGNVAKSGADAIYVYNGNTLVGKVKKGLLIQFE